MANENRRRDRALFRYSVIREAADPSLSHAERGALVRALSEREHLGPDGRAYRFGRSTLDDWIRAWRRGGFEALLDRPRVGVPRISPEVLALAEQLKREAPERSALQVVAVIEALGGKGAPKVRSLQRHFARLGLSGPGTAFAPKIHGRFEASAPNELWTGDALHGPQVKKKKAYLLAFIDDHSRLLAGYRWCTSEDSVRLEQALRAGLCSRGVPKAILVDRGSAFVASPLARACAVLGIRLIHARPRAAATKGKIERFFRTVRSQFLVELEARGGAGDLGELNRLFSAWVEVVYHRRVHSETKATPLERFLTKGAPRLPEPALLHEAFLWSEWRTVTVNTAQVSLFGNRFEVDAALAGRRIELVFDPFDLTDIEVRFDNRPMGRAVAVKVSRHTHPRARPEAAPVVVPSGIDYLAMVAAKRARELGAAPIDYAGLVSDETEEEERP